MVMKIFTFGLNVGLYGVDALIGSGTAPFTGFGENTLEPATLNKRKIAAIVSPFMCIFRIAAQPTSHPQPIQLFWAKVKPYYDP